MSADRQPQHLLVTQTTNLAVGANAASANITDGDFSLEVWGTWDGATVNVYLLSPDATPILLEAFTENGARFGRIGQIPRVFKAEVVSAGASTSLNCAVHN